MNKAQLQARADELNIAYDAEDTNKVLEAKIAEKENLTESEDNQVAPDASDSVIAEENEKDRETFSLSDEELSQQAGAVTTQSLSDAKVENDNVAALEQEAKNNGVVTTADFKNAKDESASQKSSNPEPVVEETPEPKKDEVVYVYSGDGDYYIGPYKFSKDKPFVVVSKKYADEKLKDNVDIRKANSDEIEDYYSN